MELPPGMIYQRFAPGSGLAPYIEHFWIIDAEVGPVIRQEILVPNGRPVILINLMDPGQRIDPETGTMTVNDSAVTGIATRPFIIGQRGHSRLVAAQPSPFGLCALGAPLAVDRTVPLADWMGRADAAALVAAVADADFGEDAARSLETALAARLKPLTSVKLERLERAIRLIEARKGDIEVKALVEALGLGHDPLYRDFRRHIGISPKTFIAIIRYQNLVGSLLSRGFGDGLAQLALMQGYYDQAHANRDFRRYTGVTPTRFRQTLNGIARMMHGL